MESVLWSDRFEIGIDELFELQDEIAGAVASRLAVQIDFAQQKQESQYPRDMRAYGLVLRGQKLLLRFSHLRVTRVDQPEHNRVHLDLEGAATFLRLPLLAQALDAVPRGRELHVHLDRLQFVDHAVLHLLLTFQKQYEATGGTLFIDWEGLHARFDGSRAPEESSEGRAETREPAGAVPSSSGRG